MEEYITPNEVSKILGIGRTNTYKLVGITGFPKIIIGKKILIPKEAFEKYMKKIIGSKITID